MKKLILLIFSVIAINTIIKSQSSPLVLVSVQGEITYKGNSKKTLDVAAGSLLSVTGSLKLKDNASAVLLCNEGFNLLTAGKHDLKKLCGDTVTIKSIGIDETFSKSILSSVELAYMTVDRSESWNKLKDATMMAGDGWGTGDKGGWGTGDKGGWGTGDKGGWGTGDKGGWGTGDKGGWGTGDKGGWGTGDKGGWGTGDKGGWGTGDKGGWGGTGNGIIAIMPIGKLQAKATKFSWSMPANTSSYMLRILDMNKNVIDSIQTKDTFAMIDLSKKGLVAGDTYYWQVTGLGSESGTSSSLPFMTISGDAKRLIQPKLSKSKIYYKLDATGKLLMEASAYEKDEMFYQASETYSKIRKQDSKNNLGRMMHAAFWLRGGFTILADTAINP